MAKDASIELRENSRNLTAPSLVFEAQQFHIRLARTRKSQGLLLGKAGMIGLKGLRPHIRESLTQEALTTSAIEGEKLDPESVCSAVT